MTISAGTKLGPADGTRFLVNEREPDTPLTAVVNLATELKKR